jgi:serine/threonine protein phosphatase PrpC
MAIARSTLRSIPCSPTSRPSGLGACHQTISVVPPAPRSPGVSLAPRRHLAVKTALGARTAKGRERADNQDSFLVDPRLGLAVLCDGMGGHAAGARASTLAARVFRQAILAGKALIRAYIDPACPEPVTKREISDLLREAAAAASRAVYEDATRHVQRAGMGTTLVAVLVLDNHAFIVNVGDSRAYLLRGAALEQLTRDHTVYDELIRTGRLPPGTQPRAGFRNILTRAVGTSETCDADTLVLDVAKGDRILLCSDGVHQYFDAPDGSLDDLQHELLEADGQRVADALIEIANERGGCDDMTALVLTIGALGDYEADDLDALATRYDAFARSPLFATLNERERSSILGLTEARSFQPGETIIDPEAIGGDLYILLRGAVTVDGPGTGMFELDQGQQVASTAWLDAKRRSTRAVATEPTELLVLPRQGLFALFQSDPELADRLLRQIES